MPRGAFLSANNAHVYIWCDSPKIHPDVRLMSDEGVRSNANKAVNEQIE